MTIGHLSRREFVAAAGALTMARPAGARQLTAGTLVEQIRAHVGIPWRDNTVDGLKTGDPSLPVTGAVVTVMATIDVLRRAAATKKNFVITQEPVFYGGNDNPGPRDADAVYRAKLALIAQERLAVFRFTDHWNASHPQTAPTMLANALGWRSAPPTGNPRLYQIPSTTLGALAEDVRRRLNLRGGARLVGRTDLTVQRVYLSPGTTDVPGLLANIAQADVVIAGEPREWEAVPYIADCVSAGQPKGMIAIGRLVSEEPGMLAAADWLKSFLPSLEIEAVRSADPYWSPRS
jgi:putative NIF3 family GTP cyclohydrolase 1 type 2